MRIEPAAAVVGAIGVPGAKGICERGVLLGAIAEGESELRGFGHSADADAAIEVVRGLGAEVRRDGDALRVEGRGLRGLVEPAGPLECGSVLTIVAGLLAGQNGRFELTGDAQPVLVDEPLRLMGAQMETADGQPPVVIRGGALRRIRFELPFPSADLKSSLLLAGLLAADGPTTVVEPAPTHDHTERLLRVLGAKVTRSGQAVSIWPVERIPPLSIDIPGDFSAAAPFVVAATLLSESELILQGVNVNPRRTGLLDALDRMGGRVTQFNRREQGGEPVADLEVRSAPLTATRIPAAEVPRLADELPLFALLAGSAHGTSDVRGLRTHETVTTALRGVGVRVEARDDGFRVRGVPTRPRGGAIDAAGDPRLAILGAVAGLVSREGVDVGGAEAAAITFPGFFELLNAVTTR